MVRELDQFLDADACGSKNLDGRPSPEGAFFFEGEVASPAGGQVGDVDPARDRVPALQFLAVHVDYLAGCGGQRGIEPGPGGLAFLVGGADQGGQDRKAGAGSLVHGGLEALALFVHGAFTGLDRAGCAPSRPPGRILGGPPGDVQVERPDDQQLAAGGGPVADQPPVLVPDLPEPLFPGRGNLRVQVQREDARVVLLQVSPEQAA